MARQKSVSLIIAILLVIMIMRPAYSTQNLTASWYSEASCRREGTSGIMANGRKLNDNNLTCASWDYSFGTRLAVRNLHNGKIVFVTVTDRGPVKRLYRQGRVLDLSKAAFAAIADLKQGIIEIAVERRE